VGEAEGKRPLGRPRLGWRHSVKTNLKATGWDEMAWVSVSQDRDSWWTVVNAVMNIRVT
jgi:hypothetical protein